MRSSILKTFTALMLLLGWAVTVPAAFIGADINGSLPAGSVVDNGGGSYSVTGGGSDIWDTTDQFFYAYESYTGDFDVRVRVDTLTPANNWTKAGIMVRESLNHDSRMVFNRVTPTLAPGVNDTHLAYRTQTGADGAHEDGPGQASLPNGWLRLLRVGDTFFGYQSYNGQQWNLQGTLNTAGWAAGALPSTLFLGLGVTSHDTALSATAEFRNYVNLGAAPALESATAPAGVPFYFDLLFSKPVNPADAQTLANYSLPGVTLLSATLQPDAKTVRITCNRLNLPGCRTLTVNNIKDIAGNTIAANSTIPVIYADGAVRYRQYNGIGGGAVSDLTGNAAFPNSPNRDLFVGLLENPEGGGDHFSDYGAFLDGKLTVPVSGNYQFYIASDDNSTLWLSTDESPANKVQLAHEPAWSGFRTYLGPADGGGRDCTVLGSANCNISAPVALTAGCRYHIEYIYKEGGGGDYGSVAWRMPGNPEPANGSAPIPAQFLSINNGVPVAITAASPANVNVPAGSSATFTLNVTAGTPTINYQWYRNSGMGFAPIPGANSSSYNIPVTSLADNGSSFFAIVVNPLNVVTSRVATLTVTSDTFPPKLDAAWVGAGNTTIYLQYSEIMLQSSVEDNFAYTLSSGTFVSAAVRQPGGSNVILTTSTPIPPGPVTLTITGVTDPGAGAPMPNVIVPNPTVVNLTVDPFLNCVLGQVQRERYDGLSGPNNLSTLFSNPKYPAAPDVLNFITTMEQQPDSGDNYGMRYAGHIIPTVSGNYRFEMHMDDSGRLSGSPNANASSASTLINIDGSCCGFYNVGPIPMVAGKAYYFDAIMQEGGGGDYLQIRWQPPGSAAYVAIPSANLAYCYDMSITTPPASVSALPYTTVSMSVGVSTAGAAQAAGKLRYQWEYSPDNGMNWAPLPGETKATLTGPADPAYNNFQFRVVVTVADIPASAKTSAPATLTVLADQPPAVAYTLCDPGLSFITVVYNEPVNPSTAADQFSYTVDGITPGPVVQVDSRTYRLPIALTAGRTYAINIINVEDLAVPPNAISADPGITVQHTACAPDCAGLKFETYNTGGGTAVANLTSHPFFPNNPDQVTLLPQFDTGADFRDNYGARLRGLFFPPASGNYVFYLHSDDSSELWLNPNGTSVAGKVKIAEETGCCRAWPQISSVPIPLQFGQGYYIEGLYKEGGGGDYIRVAARLQGSADPLVGIPRSQLGQVTIPGSLPLTITQPQSVTVTQPDPVSFSVNAVLPAADWAIVKYQWEKRANGTPDWVPIPGAVGQTYGFAPSLVSQSGDCYRVQICTLNGITYSDAACMTVLPDMTPPTLVDVLCGPAFDRWTLVFSEFMDKDSVEDYFAYAVDGVPLTAGSVILNPDGKTVTLLFPQTENTAYTLTVGAVNDLAGNGSAPIVRQISSCVVGCNVPALTFETYPTDGQTSVAALLTDPDYPNNPDSVRRMTTFDTRAELGTDNFRDNYGARLRGLFFPPVTGDYNFYLHSDDASEFYINPNGASPVGKIKIAEELGCCRDWPTIQSAPVYLVAGRAYYIEGLYKEGGGGDYIRVAARLVGSADTLVAIPLNQLGGSAPAGFYGTVGLVCQPVSTKVCLVVPGATGALDENFDAGNGGFTVVNNGAIDQPWSYDAGSGTWRAGQNDHLADTSLVGPYLTAVGGPVSLSLTHRHSFEFNNATSGWDGGQVQISVNGGPYTAVPAAAFSANGYQGTVLDGGGPLQNQLGFINDSPGYGSGTHITSTATLGNFSPGDVIRFRFLAAYDGCCFQGQPSWEITSVNLTGAAAAGQVPATFTVCPTETQAGQLSIQWEKSVGGGAFAPIPGATSATLSFLPRLIDNGTCYRAQLCMPAYKVTSDTACLEVVRPNTPPSFVCPPNQVVAEDSGPQTVAGLLGPVMPDNIQAPMTGSFNADFTSPGPIQGPSPYTANFSSGLPPNTIASGTEPPFVEPGGALRLSEQGVTGQQNFWGIPSLVPIHVNDFHASWKSKLGGLGQADGYSFNVGQGLGAFTGGAAEEGTTTGLSVCVDTFDNGTAFQPDGAEVGCDIKWNGVQLGITRVAGGTTHGPAELMKDSFVDATVDVDPLGNVTFTYDNFVVTGVIPGYTGIDIDQYLFAARTGGAAERCYIDDLSISAPPFQPAPVLPPAGSAFYGNAYMAGGVLHLTDAANGQQGSMIIEDLLGGKPLASFTMTFDALVGDGTVPPADGFAVSIANNLPNGSFGEEGAGTGLTVSFDSFDNAGGEAPAIDVFWNGAVVAHTTVPSIVLATPAEFIPIRIRLDPDGTLDLDIAGNPFYSNLPTPYTPIANARFGIGGRTGGLNEKNWIDNLAIAATANDIGGSESGQVVTFLVTADCPGLFSQQPAVSPDGTLTYTPAPNACGSCTITVVAMDNGGTDGQCGGNDRSEPCQFTITVNGVNDCPVAGSQLVNVNEDSSVAIALVYSDVDAMPNGCGNDIVSVSIVTPPIHGTLSGNPPNLIYTPTPGYPSGCGHNNGADSFTYQVSDGLCTNSAVVTIRVIEVNDCPHADARMGSDCGLPNLVPGSIVVIAPDNTNACVIFDGTLSSDVECDPLTFNWMASLQPGGAPWQFADKARTTNCFPLGSYVITLEVSDGQCAGTATLELFVISPCEAIEALIADIESATLERKNKRPLLASLKAACSSFERGSFGSGENQLGAFINKVQAQIMRDNPVEGQRFINAAQAIIDGIACSRNVGDQHQNQNGNGHADHGNGNGNGHNP